jgi:murein DD-endopeptidase MepM/ murein hydrolase activator NlpD
MKFIYKLSLAIILLFFVRSHSFAFTVDLRPEEVAPGDVFFLRIATDSDSSAAGNSPKAEFSGKTINFYQDTDNQFIALVPVDIETSPQDYSITIAFEGKEKIAYIRIKKHEFPIRPLTLPEEKVILSPENLKRAEREAEALTSILSQNTLRVWDGQFIKPTDTEASEAFGVRRIMNKKHTSVHRGMDYKGQIGTPVRALNYGTVVLRDELFFGGNTVVIDHGMGIYSIYMHLSEFHVAKDEKVSKGQIIGLVGMSGRATGPHLHLGVKLLGVNINPEALFRLEL